MAGVYVPRSPTTGVLYGVVRTHLAAFLAEVAAHTDGLPHFVVAEAQLCRYLCRPTLGQRRVRQLRDGRVAVALQRPWADGTTHLVFTPTELLARLVPLVPRPRINLLLYHGVLAPNAPWRRAVVARTEGESAAPESASAAPAIAPPTATDGRRPRLRPRYRSWAELMRHAFETDVLACPRCGGRMVLLATITDPAVIRLGLSLADGPASPGRAPPGADGTSAHPARGAARALRDDRAPGGRSSGRNRR